MVDDQRSKKSKASSNMGLPHVVLRMVIACGKAKKSIFFGKPPEMGLSWPYHMIIVVPKFLTLTTRLVTLDCSFWLIALGEWFAPLPCVYPSGGSGTCCSTLPDVLMKGTTKKNHSVDSAVDVMWGKI